MSYLSDLLNGKEPDKSEAGAKKYKKGSANANAANFANPDPKISKISKISVSNDPER